MIFLGGLFCVLWGCSVPKPPVTPTLSSDLLHSIQSMPVGLERTEKSVQVVHSHSPHTGVDYDTLGWLIRLDAKEAGRRYANRIVIITGVKVERAWDAKEDSQGIPSVQAISSDGLVGRGLKFGKADEKHLITLTKDDVITVKCLLVEDRIEFIGCTLLMNGASNKGK